MMHSAIREAITQVVVVVVCESVCERSHYVHARACLRCAVLHACSRAVPYTRVYVIVLRARSLLIGISLAKEIGQAGCD